MSNATRHIRHGVGSVRPYLYGRLDMLELAKRAFGAGEGAYSVVDACALTRRSRTHVDLSRRER